MSVVVRMEMPKGCWNCPCVNGEYGYCQADKDERQIEDPNERPSWCPIICQLPEGHGRLIDADAAYKAACEGADNWDGGCSPYRDDCIREEMDKVPTASPWHRVEEELPSMDGYDWVLGIVTGEAGYLRFHKAVMMVSFDPQYKEWFIDEYPDARITVSHWMLLPEPPKEDA